MLVFVGLVREAFLTNLTGIALRLGRVGDGGAENYRLGVRVAFDGIRHEIVVIIAPWYVTHVAELGDSRVGKNMLKLFFHEFQSTNSIELFCLPEFGGIRRDVRLVTFCGSDHISMPLRFSPRKR